MDGTIALTTDFELECFVKLFGKTKNFYKQFFGPSLKDLLKNIYPNYSDAKINLMAHQWDKLYKRTLITKNWIPEKSKIILKELKKKYMLGIITSTTQRPTLLTLRDLYSLFNFVLCADQYKLHKPNPESLNIIIKQYKLKPNNIIYVGDNINDIKFGKNAKTKTIAKVDILYTKQQLQKYRPNLIINNLGELKCLL